MAVYKAHVKRPRHARVKPTGEPVYIRITVDRHSLYHPIGISVSLSDWDFKKCVVKSSHWNFRKVNQVILDELRRAQALEIDLRLKGYKITAQRMRYMLTTPEGPDNFIEYFKGVIKDIDLENPTLALRYQSALSYLLEFRNKVSFDDLDGTFIRGFDRFLKTTTTRIGERKLHKNYVAKLHDWVRATINRAIAEGVTNILNPYARFTISREFVESEYLSFEDFSKIESVPLVGKLALSRDFFLLAAYLSGMRANELLRAKKEDIEIKDGITVLRQNISKREAGKRKVKYSIIIPKAMSIIDKYPGPFLLPFGHQSIKGATADINFYLKAVAKQAGVKPFSTKFARKTLINLLHSQHMPSSLIAQIVGHSDSKTTEKSYIATDLSLQERALSEAFK